jgi:transcriptional antiterminator RfaH
MLAVLEDKPRWYVIYTKPKQEKRAECNLNARNIKTFAPRVRESCYNRVLDRVVYRNSPFFPRYVFALFTASSMLHEVSFTRGVDNVLSFGSRPAAVDNEIIATMQTRIKEDGLIHIGKDLNPGDKVVFKNGPLKDFVGIFEHYVDEKTRVMILLTTVRYQGHILVDRDLVTEAAAKA